MDPTTAGAVTAVPGATAGTASAADTDPTATAGAGVTAVAVGAGGAVEAEAALIKAFMSRVDPPPIAFRSKVLEDPAAAWAADAVTVEDEDDPAVELLFHAVVPPRAFMSMVDDAVPAAAAAVAAVVATV